MFNTEFSSRPVDETANSFMNPLVVLYQPAMTGVAFTEQRCLLINAFFCWHNIMGINRPKWLNHWWRLLISGGVHKSAGDNYCSIYRCNDPTFFWRKKVPPYNPFKQCCEAFRILAKSIIFLQICGHYKFKINQHIVFSVLSSKKTCKIVLLFSPIFGWVE